MNEILRFHTASGLNSRRAVKIDTTIAGQDLKKGEGVVCSVQSGDRDEDVSPQPDKFDIHRKRDPKSILGFGYGPHRCQGEHISRAQLEIAICKFWSSVEGMRTDLLQRVCFRGCLG